MTSRSNCLRTALLAATLLGAQAFAVPPAALAAVTESDNAAAQTVVNHALVTVQDLRHDKEFGNARSLIARARAVLIVPSLFKAGFFFGGEGGNGVLLARNGHGWSSPAFYTLGSASFGLQIGAQSAEMVMIVMTDRALQALMKSQFKVGADAGITVVTLGSNVQSATTTDGRVADIVVWSSSSGAYAGLTVDGTLIEPRDGFNQEYYGRALKPSAIVLHNQGVNAHAGPLRRALVSVD